MSLHSNRHPEGLECPFCKKLMDATSYVSMEGGKQPRKGDITMCFYCGEIAMFATNPLRLRKPTDKEYLDLAEDQKVRRMRSAWVALQEAERKAKETKINTFRPWSEEFETALNWLVDNREQHDVAILSWRLFFYAGALMAYGRISEMQGGYSDFMMAIRRMCDELKAEMQAAHDDGVGQGIYVDASDNAA